MRKIYLGLLIMSSICFAKNISLDSFKKLERKEITIVDILASTQNKNEVMTYLGYELTSVLDELFGGRKMWSQEKKLIFKCKDGYRSEIPVKTILENKPYIVFQIKGSKDFKIKNNTQGSKFVNLSPYYVVWSNQDMQKTGYSRFWPYQVVEILIP